MDQQSDTSTTGAETMGAAADAAAVAQPLVARTPSSAPAVASEELFGFMVESIHDYAIFGFDPEGRIISWNKGAERIFGYTQEEILGRSSDLIFTPEDVAHDEPARERGLAVQNGRAQDDRWHRRKDGTRFWANGIVSPLRDEAGKLRGFVKVARDNTERKLAEAALRESEERLRIAVETAKMGTWELDIATGQLDCSENCKANFGLPPEAKVTYDRLVGMVYRDDQASMTEAMQHAIATRSIYEAEYRVIWPDGSQHWIVASGRALYSDNGEPQRMVGVTLDITGRKRAEAERENLLAREQEARRDAEAANRAKDEFLATLSHEMRTPLNAILGWSRLLSTGSLTPEETATALQTIDRNAKAQAQLINDILDVSRIISGKLRIEPAPVDLVVIVEAALETARPSAAARDVELRKVIEASEITVLGDANRLQQIVWNLLSNSIKFTPPHGIVEVKLTRAEDHANIVVTDTGQGIDPEFLPHVFDRFRQADSSSTRKHTGLGLGLAIVRHLTELHGGKATADSTGRGQGATFTICLPLNEPQRQDTPIAGEGRRQNPVQEGPSPAACPPILQDLKVLVVDDQPDALELVRTVLEQCGATVQTAGSVDAAKAQFDAAPPDVLVTDISMPDADGYALIQYVRSLPPERGGRVPAVALTAYARVEDRMKVLASGFQMHVPKPVDPAELLAVLANLAKWRNSG